jgi:outer membrane lipoprotein-sorting protein
MSTRKHLAAALCALAVSVPLAAAKRPAPVTLDMVIKKVQEQQKNTRTLQASFRQEKELALLAAPEVSTGTFSFSKPSNVLWAYDAPKRVQMLIANGMMTTYYPDLKKAETIDIKKFEDRIFKYMGASGAIDELARYFDFTFTDTKNSPTSLLDLHRLDLDGRGEGQRESAVLDRLVVADVLEGVAGEAHQDLDRPGDLPHDQVRVRRGRRRHHPLHLREHPPQPADRERPIHAGPPPDRQGRGDEDPVGSCRSALHHVTLSREDGEGSPSTRSSHFEILRRLRASG